MSDERRARLTRRREAYLKAHSLIDAALADSLEASGLIKDIPFLGDAHSDLHKAWRRMRGAQKRLIVAVYDLDTRLGRADSEAAG